MPKGVFKKGKVVRCFSSGGQTSGIVVKSWMFENGDETLVVYTGADKYTVVVKAYAEPVTILKGFKALKVRFRLISELLFF